MQELFSLEDIFNVMIELESLGYEHYIKMETMTKDLKLKALFANLANQEKAHKALYTKYKSESITFDNNKVNDEYTQYMDALLGSTVAFLSRSGEIKDFDHGFDIAVTLEKDTIMFLNEIKSLIGESYSESIDQIIDQEKNHLVALYAYLSKQ